MLGSPIAQKPPVSERLNLVVTSLSPTLAGRESRCSRLWSHIEDAPRLYPQCIFEPVSLMIYENSTARMAMYAYGDHMRWTARAGSRVERAQRRGEKSRSMNVCYPAGDVITPCDLAMVKPCGGRDEYA